MRRWSLVWLAAVAAAAALAAEWMRAPGAILGAGLALLALAALAAVWRAGREAPGRWMRVVGAALLAGLAITALASAWSLTRLRADWPVVRERVVTRASLVLDRALGANFDVVRRLADRAADVQAPPGPERFQRLEALVGAGNQQPARGVVLFDASGRATAWAGTLRVPLAATGPELSTVTTPFYLWLVARRQADSGEGGGTAVAAVMLARASYAPPAGVAMTDRFAERAGVGLRFFQPGGAPSDSDVFDYVLPRGLKGGDTLFAVQPVPPEQDAAIADQLAQSRRMVFWLTLALLLVGAAGSVRSGVSVAGAVAGTAAAALFLARAPLEEAFGPGSLFSAATYYQDVLGPYSASAGKVILTGLVVALGAAALWRVGLRPTWLSRLAALGVTVLAPYLLQDLARGITPPAEGVSLVLWLTWQVTLVLAASALVLFAAALVRGGGRTAPSHAGPWPFLASALAVALAVAGLFLWKPSGAWPQWYPYLWLPALLVAIRPMPFRSAIATVAVVAGSAAALLEWGETTEGRIALASRDLEALGTTPDPLKVALFDRLVRSIPPTTAPQTAGDLYLLWRRSDFAVHDYPAALGLWTDAGAHLLQLDLASLDLPDSLVRSQVLETMVERLPLVRSYLRRPGVYGLATIPLSDGHVVTVGVAPQSRLVAPSRVARFLAGTSETEPPYRLSVSPVEAAGTLTERASWRRDGWTIRGERVVDMLGGRRHVHAQVDLGGLSPLLQRGLLVLVLDFGVLASLWLVLDLVGGRLVPNLRVAWPRSLRSLRARLTVSLAAFFVVPTVALAVWSYERQGDEFLRSRELLITRTLRDASAALEDLSMDRAAALREVAENVDAELVLTQNGVQRASSAPVLSDLGLVDWLVPPTAYTRLVYGDYLELTRRQRTTPQPVLVGYTVLGGTSDILVSPQLLTDEALGARQEDLGVAVMVAAVIGIVAAIVLSGLAARALARPLAHLAQAALAAGTGLRPAGEGGPMPSELQPVYRAIEQAAADVERGQEAQRVLAWGEMARQVAHEIKNPLTPIRLGIQHLMRLNRERPAELGAVVDTTGPRILAEIDRLDAIARAFSRFAVPTENRPALEAVDASEVVREVIGLYRLGETPVRWDVAAEAGVQVRARRDELSEVLVNLFENARDAGATRVVVRAVRCARESGGPADQVARLEVEDDGRGIPAELLPRVFEPRFSTTTSGSGLGLAIARRLVEGWGGTIALRSTVGRGTTVALRLAGPERDQGLGAGG